MGNYGSRKEKLGLADYSVHEGDLMTDKQYKWIACIHQHMEVAVFEINLWVPKSDHLRKSLRDGAET